jgi:hypothetical protein
MAKPVNLPNGRRWRTRSEAIAHFKAMLGRYSDGERISDVDDSNDLTALLTVYDSVVPAGQETKTGCGVEYFSKQRNADAGYSTSGFHVHRRDGTSIDFSFYRAIQTDNPKTYD